MTGLDQVFAHPLAPRSGTSGGGSVRSAPAWSVDTPSRFGKPAVGTDAPLARDDRSRLDDSTAGRIVVVPMAMGSPLLLEGARDDQSPPSTGRARSTVSSRSAPTEPISASAPAWPPGTMDPRPAGGNPLALGRFGRPLRSATAGDLDLFASHASPLAAIPSTAPAGDGAYAEKGQTARTNFGAAERTGQVVPSFQPLANPGGFGLPARSGDVEPRKPEIGAIGQSMPPDVMAHGTAHGGFSRRPAAPLEATGESRDEGGRRPDGPAAKPSIQLTRVVSVGPSRGTNEDTRILASAEPVDKTATTRLAAAGEVTPRPVKDRMDGARTAGTAASGETALPSMRVRTPEGVDRLSSVSPPEPSRTPDALATVQKAVVATQSRAERAQTPPPPSAVSVEIGRVEIQVKAPKVVAPVRRTPARRHRIDPGFTFGTSRRW